MISTLSEVIGSSHHSFNPILFSFKTLSHIRINSPNHNNSNRFNQLKSRILIVSSFIIYHSHSILHISTSSSIHLHYPHNIYSSFYLNSSIEITQFNSFSSIIISFNNSTSVHWYSPTHSIIINHSHWEWNWSHYNSFHQYHHNHHSKPFISSTSHIHFTHSISMISWIMILMESMNEFNPIQTNLRFNNQFIFNSFSSSL